MILNHYCSPDVPVLLHDVIKDKVSEISWLDVNEPIHRISETCIYTIRYYPCTSGTTQIIKTTITELFARDTSQYHIVHMGHSYPIEGYCALKLWLT